MSMTKREKDAISKQLMAPIPRAYTNLKPKAFFRQPTRQRYAFAVEGAGQFPYDMLRYDACWPSSQEDVANMCQHHEKRMVRMSGTAKPTVARWYSFLWQVIPVDRWH